MGQTSCMARRNLYDYLLQDPVVIDRIDSAGDDLAPEGQQPLNKQPSLS